LRTAFVARWNGPEAEHRAMAEALPPGLSGGRGRRADGRKRRLRGWGNRAEAARSICVDT